MPEAFGQGDTLEEARESVTQAVRAALDARVVDGKPLPPSGQVTVGPITIARNPTNEYLTRRVSPSE